jgi:hypothetical protein
MKPALLSILFFLLVSSGVYSQQGQLVPTDRFTGVIFSAEDYNSPEMWQTLGYAVGEDVLGVWTPTKEEVMRLETALITMLQTMSREEAPVILASLHSYRRQYLGVVVKNQRLLVANFDRCSEFEEGQLEASFIPFLPFDGGSCFIELLFDPVTKTFQRVYIHGEA